MPAFDRYPDTRFQLGGERLAEIEPHGVDPAVDRLAHHRPGQPPFVERTGGEGGDAGRQSRERPGRGIAGGYHDRKLAAGDGGDQFGNQIGLGREVAINGAGGDAGAFCDRSDLHRPHAAIGGNLRGGFEDRLLPLGQAANHVFGAAVGHGNE